MPLAASPGGGDWDLEVTTGEIAASSAIDQQRLGSYEHVLVTTAVSTLAELKSAIATGVADNVDDVITLTGNIIFTSSSDTISIDVADAHTLQIVGGGFALDGANKSQVLKVKTSGANSQVALDNITIRNGLIAGNGGDESTAAADSLGAGIYNEGVLTITNSTITGNKASGGGGGGGDGGSSGNGFFAGGGGGGGGFGSSFGGKGGSSSGVAFPATDPTGITGGYGAGARIAKDNSNNMGGRGGSASGGAGGSYYGDGNSTSGYTVGGAGGTASGDIGSIGGGGGGVGVAATGARVPTQQVASTTATPAS